MSSKEAAQHLGRSVSAVRNKAGRLGTPFRVKEHADGTCRKRWTKTEETMLWGLAEWCSIEQAARRLGRSYGSVKMKAEKLGISFKANRMTLSELAELLGVGVPTVQRRRNKLGLKFRQDKEGGTPQYMRGPSGKDIVAIAEDILKDPPLRGLPNTNAKKLRTVIEEYQGWE